ncbi:MAG: methionine--tRNA ligase subunit beta [Candidatus Omnitrophica bacterium]|nr:methionine--tRNA ligase subunit beta [Candidatus Omnitrophota bacterium]MDD5351661.1 methionine--tRNA ligase subunit beta [Candidatus Omnitrophota bacterium]MDD5550871.1 methionine--tRNA ligase subunit beta [Candidatus Omnitrophota bacterium]
MVTIGEFRNIEIRIATIKEVNDHPNADKLYLVKVDLGDKQKELVAGIKPYYAKESLIGKQVVVVDNLEPAVIRGVESQGMLLAAQDESGIVILSPERNIKEGSRVK